MSLVGRTISAFPLGKTTEELFVLLESDFDPQKRLQILGELDLLLDQGKIRKGRNGRWYSQNRGMPFHGEPELHFESGILNAVIAEISQISAPNEDSLPEPKETSLNDPIALLRYYRSTLRSDPRGAISETEDRHSQSWQVLSGSGDLVPESDGRVLLSMELDSLPDQFREAVFKRQTEENVLAVGWPLAVGQKSGLKTIWPVGMLSGKWVRTDSTFQVIIDKDDVLVNPSWIKSAASRSSWSKTKLSEVFLRLEGTGLPLDEFSSRLREAAASKIITHLKPNNRSYEVNLDQEVIHNLFGLFLPTETTFNTGPANDLDKIAQWKEDILQETALAEILGLKRTQPLKPIPAINFNPLNSEQIIALEKACTSGLTVVEGPPGTGKSQTIVSMVCSILVEGGAVLFASRNHKALDAVQDRLSTLTKEEVPFSIRTIDPEKEIDQDFSRTLNQLCSQPSKGARQVHPEQITKLRELAHSRTKALNDIERLEALHLELAVLIERLFAHSEKTKDLIGMSESDLAKLDMDDLIKRLESSEWFEKESVSRPSDKELISFWYRLLRFLLKSKKEIKESKAVKISDDADASIRQLSIRLEELRDEIASLEEPNDPVRLTEEITEITKRIITPTLARRTNLTVDQRKKLGEKAANFEFQGKQPDKKLASEVINHRPLWIASILGTPKRVPLIPNLFDLVIFDEASQCDIASALPLFARAKRAVVVGDDHQLSYIPQLGLEHDRNLMIAQSLDPGSMGRFSQSRKSLFGMATLVPDGQNIQLRKQYRSASDIVDYISGEYYGGRLNVAVDPNDIKSPKKLKPGIAWSHVPAPHTPQPENINPNEVRAIIEHLEELLLKEKYEGTVGVITPFRSQARQIGEEIKSHFESDLIESAALQSSTVDSFQGQERDVILFSPCLGQASTSSALTFVQRDWRRLNVAISRARAVAHVFGDLDFVRKGSVQSLNKLARWALEKRKTPNDYVFDSHWERLMYVFLQKKGLDPKPQYEIAGRRLDFALFGKNGIKLDLEIDGRYWHTDIDGNRKRSDLWRDHQLKSLGWRVRRFWVDELSKDMEGSLDIIKKDLE